MCAASQSFAVRTPRAELLSVGRATVNSHSPSLGLNPASANVAQLRRSFVGEEEEKEAKPLGQICSGSINHSIRPFRFN